MDGPFFPPRNCHPIDVGVYDGICFYVDQRHAEATKREDLSRQLSKTFKHRSDVGRRCDDPSDLGKGCIFIGGLNFCLPQEGAGDCYRDLSRDRLGQLNMISLLVVFGIGEELNRAHCSVTDE